MADEDNPDAELKPADPKAKMQKLEEILNRFEISIAEANDLVVLDDYEIVLICDDSGSMTMASLPPNQRKLGVPTPSRWDELKETVSLIVDLGNCFDDSGLDVYFLNREPIKNVMSSTDPRFIQAFNVKPRGTTPLTRTLKRVVQDAGGEKPVLLFILTDGVPDDGPNAFSSEIASVVKKKSTKHTFKVQIMACTDDDEAIGYLNDLDKAYTEVDCTDDYYSERAEVLKAGRVQRFSRGDWCLKAMLGPVSQKFDNLDEEIKGVRKSLTNLLGGGGASSGGAKKSSACVMM